MVEVACQPSPSSATTSKVVQQQGAKSFATSLDTSVIVNAVREIFMKCIKLLHFKILTHLDVTF